MFKQDLIIAVKIKMFLLQNYKINKLHKEKIIL
jgi:hypothetical protein